jgi:DNA-binding IclR family transcriptional regulator
LAAPEAWCVGRTVQALELLAFGALSAPQLAVALQSHPRTARRLLTRLEQEGYLTLVDDSRRLYAPTMRIVALAAQVVENSELAHRARPYVARLHEQTGAPAHLAVPSYRSVLCLVHYDHRSVALRPQLRELVPAHCTAGGKALLAWRDLWREDLITRPLERHTDRTLTEPDALLRDTDETHRRGYAIEDGEYQADVRAVAAPVFAHGEAVGAVTLSGRDLDVEATIPRVTAIAGELSADLDGPGAR